MEYKQRGTGGRVSSRVRFSFPFLYISWRRIRGRVEQNPEKARATTNVISENSDVLSLFFVILGEL